MKALTITPPWPWAICYFAKPVENRDWRPSVNHLRTGERFAIHAGLLPSVVKIRQAFAHMVEMGVIESQLTLPDLAQLKTQEGAIVAVATFGGAVTEHPSPWFAGLYAWRLLGLDDKTPLIVLAEPVKCKGSQGLWNVPDDVLAKMRSQFSKDRVWQG